MLDKKFLRDGPEIAKDLLRTRGEHFADEVDRFIAIDEQRRALQLQLDQLRAEKNSASKEIGELMKAGNKESAEAQKDRMRLLNEQIDMLDSSFATLDREERELLLGLPNYPHDSIPVGGEDKAEIVFTKGEPRQFKFTPRDHVELCEHLQLVNFEAGSRIAGSGFPVLVGNGAMLQRALINLMLDVHVHRHHYTELRPPFITHPRCPEGTGQLPKFGSEMYHVYIEGQPGWEDYPGPHYYLIPTAEVPVVNYYRDTILEQPVLPLKLCAYSPCWRVEGGSYGKEARGLTRLHQFEKVELVCLADPETSWETHERMTEEAEHILALLGLPYRRKVLPTGDMAFGSAKTYDIEVHCPVDNAWREISSASNTTDYQARRANIRFRRNPGAKVEYPHLLNASGLALPRLIIALLENYQTPEGNVQIPEALHKYLPHLRALEPPCGAPPFV
jgi:seryl-tRNA synthetase